MTTGTIIQVDGAIHETYREASIGIHVKHLTTNIFQIKCMNLQIRSVFDTEPTSAELTSSRKRFAKRPSHQWNTQSAKSTVWKRMAIETRTPNDPHPRSRRTVPQESGDNAPKHGGMPKLKRETAETNQHTHPFKDCGPTVLKHHPRTRTKPPSQRRLSATALHPKTTMYRNRARFDKTDVPQKGQMWHGDLHPLSPTKHME